MGSSDADLDEQEESPFPNIRMATIAKIAITGGSDLEGCAWRV